MVFALLAGVGLSQAIDFHAPGMTLERAVKSLGEQIGQPLYVSNNIRNDVVVIHAANVTFEDLKSQIADAANAEWKQTNTGLVLDRSPQKERELRQASIVLRAKAIRDYLSTFEEALAKEFTADDAKQIAGQIVAIGQNDRRAYNPEMNKVWAHGPAARLAHRLLLGLNAEHLVDLPFGSRRVFALNPTKLQFGLGKDASAAFEKYVQEQNVWAAAVQGYQNPPELNIVSNPLTKKDPVVDVPTDLCLELKRTNMDATIFCNLTQPSDRVGYSPIYQVIAQPYRAMGEFAAVKDLPTSVAPLVRFCIREAFAFNVPMPVAPTDEEVEKLYDPASCDMAGLVANSVLTTFYPDRNVVAVVGDGPALYMCLAFSAYGDLPKFEKNLPLLIDADLRNDGKWVVVEPRDPYLVSFAQTSRESVRSLLSKSRKTQSASFEDLSELNARSNEPSVLAGCYLRALGISGWQEIGQQNQWHISRIYGSLTESQRLALANGGRVQFGDLVREQKDLFTALTTSREIDSVEPTGPGSARQMGRIGEPTVLLASGIPGDAALTLEVVSERLPFTYTKVSEGLRMAFPTNPYSIAATQKANDEGRQESNGTAFYAMGTLRTYKFRVRYADDMWQLFSVREQIADPDAKPGPWTDLPADIVEQVKKSMGGG